MKIEKNGGYAADCYLHNGNSLRLMEANAYKEFISRQKREVMRNWGIINPEDIEAYIESGGFRALETAITKMTPERVKEEIKRSELRDRGPEGRLTGQTWEAYRQSKPLPQYIISVRLGGPGEAWIERTLLEGNPFALIEGMTIVAYALGGISKGIIYIPSAYKPLAFRRLERALRAAEARRYLGRNILAMPFSFDIEIRETLHEDLLPKENNPFICSECARALFALEEERKYLDFQGWPDRPGIFYLNNVETYMNIPLIISKGAEWFRSLGKKDRGTKIFALTGKTRHPCLVEAPLGTTLAELLQMAYGESSCLMGNLKAFQLGGPAGGIFPERFQNLPLEFDSLAHLGWQVGSGYLVLMDESVCIVDIARYSLTQIAAETCASCHPCNRAWRNLLSILNRLTKGLGEAGDIETLEIFAKNILAQARCSFGRAAVMPILTSLNYFRSEFESHLKQTCPAQFCRDLRPGGEKVIKLAA